jgi:hypothetical protein
MANTEAQMPILYDIKEYANWINEIDLNKAVSVAREKLRFQLTLQIKKKSPIS